MRSVPLTALSLTLGFFFVFIGLLKVTPQVNPEMYRHLQLEFGRFNKAFPLSAITGWKPYARTYRLAVGIMEIVCGSVMVLLPGRAKELANALLLFMMGFSLWTHHIIKDPFDRMAPALVFGSLLMCRLIIAYQIEKRERLEIENEILRNLHEEVAHAATVGTEGREKAE